MILIYCLVYFAFNSMYGGFKTGSARYGEGALFQRPALVFVNVVTYLQLRWSGGGCSRRSPWWCSGCCNFHHHRHHLFFQFVYFQNLPGARRADHLPGH